MAFGRRKEAVQPPSQDKPNANAGTSLYQEIQSLPRKSIECALGGQCPSLSSVSSSVAVTDFVHSRTATADALFNTTLILILGSVGLYKTYQRSRDNDAARKAALTNKDNGRAEDDTTKEKPASVKSFQRRFLPVFWSLRLAFWMAGPYFYPVYASKVFSGQPASAKLISNIFLAGFGAIVVFAPWTGQAIDQHGRKLGTLAAVITYALGALSTKSNSLLLLILGRAVGGIGTNLLSGAPESWLVSTAMKTGDDNEGTYLKETFGLAFAYDPVVAILAGQIAGWSAGYAGPTGPFLIMPVFLFLAGLIAFFSWEENRGGTSSDGDYQSVCSRRSEPLRAKKRPVERKSSIIGAAARVGLLLRLPSISSLLSDSKKEEKEESHAERMGIWNISESGTEQRKRISMDVSTRSNPKTSEPIQPLRDERSDASYKDSKFAIERQETIDTAVVTPESSDGPLPGSLRPIELGTMPLKGGDLSTVGSNEPLEFAQDDLENDEKQVSLVNIPQDLAEREKRRDAAIKQFREDSSRRLEAGEKCLAKRRMKREDSSRSLATVESTNTGIGLVRIPSLNHIVMDDMADNPTVRDGFKMIMIDKKMMMLGAVQSLFEGSMYIFVMQWPPAVIVAVKKYYGQNEGVPFGTIFSCFMACCMVGSTAFGKLSAFKGAAHMEKLFLGMLAVSAASMIAATWAIRAGYDFVTLSLSFFVFEACVGMYFPLVGFMRGKYLHASHRSVIMTLFSVPLNILVVSVCLFIGSLGTFGAFCVASAALAIATICMAVLICIRKSEARRYWVEVRKALRRVSMTKTFVETAKRRASLKSISSEIKRRRVRENIRESLLASARDSVRCSIQVA